MSECVNDLRGDHIRPCVGEECATAGFPRARERRLHAPTVIGGICWFPACAGTTKARILPSCATVLVSRARGNDTDKGLVCPRVGRAGGHPVLKHICGFRERRGLNA